ncbi:transposase domain-containing protein [Kitasatospora sp. GAS204B]|uniref:transposase domain-containing protein n=1 Tax=unclassified Kitasatospora TaxID=2633591 RepID=UPI0024750705|nr:transposase domain-containing protein [Kitasatospora sp. GAS204B]
MPRSGQVKPSTDERLSDRIAIGLLTHAFPPELVDRIVEECGRTGRRQRLLPPRGWSISCWRCACSPGRGRRRSRGR